VASTLIFFSLIILLIFFHAHPYECRHHTPVNRYKSLDQQILMLKLKIIKDSSPSLTISAC